MQCTQKELLYIHLPPNFLPKQTPYPLPPCQSTRSTTKPEPRSSTKKLEQRSQQIHSTHVLAIFIVVESAMLSIVTPVIWKNTLC